MLSESDGIEGVLEDYVRETVPAEKEAEMFGANFAAFLQLLDTLKREGGHVAPLPVEVTDPQVKPETFRAIADAFRAGTINAGREKSRILVPVLKTEGKRLVAHIHDYRPETGEGGNGIADGVRQMEDALKYLHASPERPDRYARTYEFLKSFALVFGAEGGPSVSPAKVDVFLSNVPMELSEPLEKDLHAGVFRDGKTQMIIDKMMGIKGLTEDSFTEWTATFQPKPFQAPWMDLLRKKITDGRKDVIKAAIDGHLNAIMDRSLRGEGTVFGAGESLKLRKQSEETAVKVCRIIDVGPAPVDNKLTDTQRATIREIVANLAGRLIAGGMKTGFRIRHLKAIREMLFEDEPAWFKPPRIDWTPLFERGYVQMFDDMKDGNDEDLYFIDCIYLARRQLEKNGLLTQEAKTLLIMELPRNINKDE